MYHQESAPVQSSEESSTQTAEPGAFAPVDAYGQATALQEPEPVGSLQGDFLLSTKISPINGAVIWGT